MGRRGGGKLMGQMPYVQRTACSSSARRAPSNTPLYLGARASTASALGTTTWKGR